MHFPLRTGGKRSGSCGSGTVTALLEESVASALAGELSGVSAKRHVEVISGSHRMRASRGFHAAAEYVAGRLREYGLEDIEILRFPADGRTMFGTQKSRLGWDVDSAELWELTETRDEWSRTVRIGDWQSSPLTLAQDSESADVTTDLVDVGSGTEDADYAGKAVRGKLVLVSSQPEAVQALAADRHGAAGIISYAQNQRTAWSGDDQNLVRWEHLDSFADTSTFGRFVNEQSLAYASGQPAEYPLVAQGGGKEALLAQLVPFSGGSDNEVYADGAFRIPSIYLNDWPDRYIHTDRDLPANLDPTKLQRAGFIGAATAWYLANLGDSGTAGLLDLLELGQIERTADLVRRRVDLSPVDAAGAAAVVYRRSASPKGPMSVSVWWLIFDRCVRDQVTRFLAREKKPRARRGFSF